MAGKPGQPPYYKTPEQMQPVIDSYFATCDEGETVQKYDKKLQEVVEFTQKIPYTIPGLILALGFGTRQSLLDYASRSDGFLDTITRAKMKIEEQRNKFALTGVYDSRFAQFDLACNFKWKEVKGIEQTGPDGGPIQHTVDYMTQAKTGLDALASMREARQSLIPEDTSDGDD